MKKIIYFLFLMTINCFAQGNNFEIILKVSGDLNKDRYPDLVTVAQDMSAEKSYQINIYFNNKKINTFYLQQVIAQ